MSRRRNSGAQISTRGYAGTGPGGGNPEWTQWRDVADGEAVGCMAFSPSQRNIAEIRVRVNPILQELAEYGAMMRHIHAVTENMAEEELLAPVPEEGWSSRAG